MFFVFWVAFLVWRLVCVQVRVQKGWEGCKKVQNGAKRYGKAQNVRVAGASSRQLSAWHREPSRLTFFIMPNTLPDLEKRALRALSISLDRTRAPICSSEPESAPSVDCRSFISRGFTMIRSLHHVKFGFFQAIFISKAPHSLTIKLSVAVGLLGASGSSWCKECRLKP